MTYDANGNLATVTNSCGTTTYTWDARNRLIAINGYASDCSALSASFGYDALNRRTSKTVNGTTTQYVYDGVDIIQEIAATGAKTDYVRTLNIDEPLTRIKADGTIRHYVHDKLGSVVALADDTGTTTTTYTYNPFGTTTVSGEASDNPFQYTGRENDGTGLYYYRARYYCPELQRFISEDPIGLGGGDVNFYRYVGNNAVNRRDPQGLISGACLKKLAKWATDKLLDWFFDEARDMTSPISPKMVAEEVISKEISDLMNQPGTNWEQIENLLLLKEYIQQNGFPNELDAIGQLLNDKLPPPKK